FNVVRSLEERVGSNFDDNEANTFSDFLLSTGLCDLPLGGRRYTRFDKEWRKASKFDRFLVTSGFFNVWNGASAKDGLLTDYDRAKREEWLIDLDYIDRIHREDLKQKSRLKWAIEGDENTRIWQEDPEEIKKVAHDHFSSRFKETRSNHPCFLSCRFRKLSDLNACFLKSSMSMEEIKEAVWGCASSKAPSPNRFNFKFIEPSGT
ncbi:hypothetical protein Tco_1413133, partial [Tanacetum coccineum]